MVSIIINPMIIVTEDGFYQAVSNNVIANGIVILCLGIGWWKCSLVPNERPLM